MSALWIDEDEAGSVVRQLLAGRASVIDATSMAPANIVGSAPLSASLAATAHVTDDLLNATAEAITLGALAVTDAAMDARRADR